MIKKTVSHKHPDFIFVKKEQDGDVTYFVASEDLADLAEMNVPILVSKYQRVSTHTLVTKPVLQPEVSHHGSAPDHVRVSETD
jgi:hypothetical protein